MKYLIYTYILLSLFSCKKEEITLLNITKSIQPIRKIPINENCFSNGIYRDSTLYFIAECSAENQYIYIYNDLLQEIFHFGEKGRLFNEFNMPFFYRNCKLSKKDSLIKMYDLNLLHEKYLNRQNINSPYNFVDGNYLPSKLYFSENLNQIDSNIIVGNTIDANNGIFFIYNYSNDSINWVDYNTDLYFNDDEIKFEAHKNIVCSNPQKKVTYVGYRFLDLIQLYDSNGKLIKNLQFSKLKKPILARQFNGISYDNPIYVIDMYATPQYCYLLRVNMTIEQLNDNQDYPCHIIILDWDGNIKDVLQIPFYMMPIVVNENDTKLFSIYPNHDNPECAYLVEFNL